MSKIANESRACVGKCISYISNDSYIANYCGVPESLVAAMRGNLPERRAGEIRVSPAPRPERLDWAQKVSESDAEVGSRMMRDKLMEYYQKRSWRYGLSSYETAFLLNHARPTKEAIAETKRVMKGIVVPAREGWWPA